MGVLQEPSPLPANPQTVFLSGLFLLAALAVLYVASPFVLPVVLAFVLMLLLQPAVSVLDRVHIPRALGAVLVILLVIGTFAGLVAALSVPAAIWAEKLPLGVPRLEAHLLVLRRPIQALQVIICVLVKYLPIFLITFHLLQQVRLTITLCLLAP